MGGKERSPQRAGEKGKDVGYGEGGSKGPNEPLGKDGGRVFR